VVDVGYEWRRSKGSHGLFACRLGMVCTRDLPENLIPSFRIALTTLNSLSFKPRPCGKAAPAFPDRAWNPSGTKKASFGQRTGQPYAFLFCGAHYSENAQKSMLLAILVEPIFRAKSACFCGHRPDRLTIWAWAPEPTARSSGPPPAPPHASPSMSEHRSGGSIARRTQVAEHRQMTAQQPGSSR